MKTTGGQIDLSGETFGTIQVVRPIRIRPQISYCVRCHECGSSWEGIGNRELQSNPKCINPAHGKKYFKTWRQEAEHELEETLHQVETEYKNNANALAVVQRKAIESLPDDEFMMSQNLRAIKSMPSLVDAIKFTQENTERFLAAHPTFYPCPENRDAICNYLRLQGVDTFCDFETMDRAYCRLYELGMIKERPAPPPPPEPEAVSESVVKKPVNTKPLMIRGIDPQTGLTKDYTQRQVDSMSSEQYRRAFFTTAEGLSRSALDLIPLLQGRLRT